MATKGNEFIFVGFEKGKPKLYHLGILLCNSVLTHGPKCIVTSLLVFVGRKKVSATEHLRELK